MPFKAQNGVFALGMFAKGANLPCFALKPPFEVQKIAWKKRIDNGYLQAGSSVGGCYILRIAGMETLLI